MTELARELTEGVQRELRRIWDDAAPVRLDIRMTDAYRRPLAGGKVYFFKAGSESDAHAFPYFDELGTIPATNPYVLNSCGEGAVYLTEPVTIVVRNALNHLVAKYGYDARSPTLLSSSEQS